MRTLEDRIRTLNILIVLIVLATLGIFVLYGFGCASSHQDRVNTISDVVSSFAISYNDLEERLVKLHNDGVLVGDSWEKVKKVRKVTAPLMIQILENWKLVPQTDASIEAFIASPDFQNLTKLVLQLTSLAATNDLEIKFSTYLR